MARGGDGDERLKKKYECDADLAFWFKLNPFELNREQKIGLLANLRRVKSQDLIHRGLPPIKSMQGAQAIYDTYLTAYGDKELASKAQANAVDAWMEAATSKSRD